MTDVRIDRLTIDPKLQPRLNASRNLIEEYKELWESGVVFPPVRVVRDGEKLLVVDGFHRVEAAKLANREIIEADIEEGDYRYAILVACAANAIHGMRRSQADKRRQVQMLLEDEEWRGWSDRKIADQCLVSPPLVAAVRDSMSLESPPTKTYQTKHGGVSTMEVGAIAKSNIRRAKENQQEEPDLSLVEKEELSPQDLFARYFAQIKARVVDAQVLWNQLHDCIRNTYPHADGFKGYLAVKNLFDTEVPYLIKSLHDARPVGPCLFCNGEGECLPCGGSRLMNETQTKQASARFPIHRDK